MRPRARDVVEDHEGAEAAVGILRVVERIDHRQAVGEHVGERRRRSAGPAPRPVMAVSGPRRRYSMTLRLDVGVLDHHGVVEHRHVGHAAVGVAGVEIAAEQRILLGGRAVRRGVRRRGRGSPAARAACCRTARTRRPARAPRRRRGSPRRPAGRRWSASGGSRPGSGCR